MAEATPYQGIELTPMSGESNWDFCKRRASAIDKDHLIRCLLKKIHEMSKKKRPPSPLWSHVGEATSHGCGISSAIVAIYLGEDYER